MIWLLMILMALVTFYNRYAFFSPRLKFSISPEIQSMLKYTAPAVLTALWVPIIFIRDNELNLDLGDPYLVAGIITIAISLIIKRSLLTVLLGLAFFFLLSNI